MQIKSLRINVVLNTIKQLCTVIFPLISIPYITRVLEPEKYGMYSFGNSFVSYFSLVAALGISTYAVREGVAFRENRKEISLFSSQMFSLNMISTVITYVLLAIVLLIPNLSPYRKIIAIQSLIIILTTIGADWINNIYEDYIYITLRYIVFQAISIVCMYLFVHKPQDYLLYAFIVVGAQSGANILNFFYVRKKVDIRFTFKIDLKKHIRPILIFFANIIAITVYVNSDITMLGLMKSDTEVGIYSLATKIYTIVKMLINAIMVVSLPRLSYLAKKEDLSNFRQLANKIKNGLMVILLPATVGMFFLSKEIIGLIGGDKFIYGSNSLAVLSVAIIFSLLATFYVSCVMIPLGLEKYILYSTIISAVANIGLNLLFIPLWGGTGAAITTLISETIVFVICLCVSKKNGDKNISGIEFLKIIIGCLLVSLICFTICKFDFLDIIKILLCIVISVPVYVIFEFAINNSFVHSEIYSFYYKIKKRINK